MGLIDGTEGAYGVTFPYLVGCSAMGASVDAALGNAVEAMREWVEVVEETGGTVPSPRSIEGVRADPDVAAPLADGAVLTTIALVRTSGRPVRAHISLDSGVLAALDAEARRQRLTRSAMVEAMTKRLAAGTL